MFCWAWKLPTLDHIGFKQFQHVATWSTGQSDYLPLQPFSYCIHCIMGLCVATGLQPSNCGTGETRSWTNKISSWWRGQCSTLGDISQVHLEDPLWLWANWWHSETHEVQWPLTRPHSKTRKSRGQTTAPEYQWVSNKDLKGSPTSKCSMQLQLRSLLFTTMPPTPTWVKAYLHIVPRCHDPLVFARLHKAAD